MICEACPKEVKDELGTLFESHVDLRKKLKHGTKTTIFSLVLE
jgi:hypothetical protein